jgi:hypothetical protein
VSAKAASKWRTWPPSARPASIPKLEEFIESTQQDKYFFDGDDRDTYVEGYHKLYTTILN